MKSFNEIFLKHTGHRPTHSIEDAVEEYINQDKWISVDERLPTIHQLVLCANLKHEWVVSGELGGNGLWYNQFQDKYSDPHIIVTHWQPLPSPPKQ